MTDTNDGSDAPAPDHADEQPALPAYGIVTYSLANLGFGAFYALNNFALPLFLKSFTSNAILLGLMGSTHSIEGSVIQPLIGSASDRMNGRFGKRKPFILAFIPLSALFMILTPLAVGLPHNVRLAIIVALIFLFTVCFNIAQDPYNALLPDITPERQRGRVSGITQFVGVAGQATLLLLKKTVQIKIILSALIMLITALVTCALVKGPTRIVEEPAKMKYLAGIRFALHGLRDLQQAAKALITLFISGIGIGAILPYLTLFVQTITHCSDNQAMKMPLILMVSTAIFVVPFGWLADKIGPKAVLLIGFATIGLAAVNGLWVDSLGSISIIMIIAGIGNAAQTAAAYPLLTDIVPKEEMGFYTGLQSTALSIAQPVTAVVTGALINTGGYRVIFGVATVCLAVAVTVLYTLNVSAARIEVLRHRGGNAAQVD